MTNPPPKSECPECGHPMQWVKVDEDGTPFTPHFLCGWCGESWFPPESEDEL